MTKQEEKQILDAMGMIRQLADLNNIKDTDLMAACFGVGLAILFIHQGKKEDGLQLCKDMICELADLSWKRMEEDRNEMVDE